MPEFQFLCECGSQGVLIFEWRPYNQLESSSVLFQCPKCFLCYEQVNNKVVNAMDSGHNR